MATPRRPQRLLTDTRERVGRSVWPTSDQITTRADTARVGVVTVSYNTIELTAHLLFSIHRVLPVGSVAELVVVDNGSTDGSVELLVELEQAGLLRLVRNRRSPYHGPGLNRGISFLAEHQRGRPDPIDLVWVVDSDVVVLAPDALARMCTLLCAERAAIVGQLQPYDQPRPRLSHYAHPASLLMDPARVWHHRIPAFLEDGAPGVMMQHVLRRRGERVVDVPVFADAAMLHLGSGTLRSLVEGERSDNRYFDWAHAHREHHFHGRADGAALYARFLADYARSVPTLNAAALIAACRTPERLAWLP